MKPMKIKAYQKWVKDDPNNIRADLDILALRLAGECGELAQSIAKRDPLQDIVLELGDTLYYMVRVSQFLGFDLAEIAGYNVEKLQKRYGKHAT